MADPASYLDAAARELWAAYERQEAAGLRKDALSSLTRFITAVCSYERRRRIGWVEAICFTHWSGADYPLIEGKLKLRHPLLVELVFPELLEGYRARRPNYARWLALFSLTPSGAINGASYQELRLRGMPEGYPPQLLREALVLDDADVQAAHALIRYLENRFEYWTHHVPDGVLTEDTTTWRQELAEFERLLERYPTGRDHAFELSGWRLHCDAWEEFLQRRGEFGSYADFLARRD